MQSFNQRACRMEETRVCKNTICPHDMNRGAAGGHNCHQHTWELWKELSGRSLQQMLGVGSKVSNLGLAGGLIGLSTDFIHCEKVWKLGERRGRLCWFCRHWTLWRKRNSQKIWGLLSTFTLTFIRYGMNIISDMNNGKGLKELRIQVSQAVTSWLNARGVEGWIDWNLCLDERGQSMDASQIWLQ